MGCGAAPFEISVFPPCPDELRLTAHYHLKHCPHHYPVAIVAWLLILILMLAFNLFEWFAPLHGKLLRAGAITLAELAQQLDRALERHEELESLWSG